MSLFPDHSPRKNHSFFLHLCDMLVYPILDFVPYLDDSYLSYPDTQKIDPSLGHVHGMIPMIRMTQMSMKSYNMIIYQHYNEYIIISNEYNNDMKTVYSIFFPN